MPNGGPAPDCVHCAFYRGLPHEDKSLFCNRHTISLPSPIKAFCSKFVDLAPDDKGDWLDQKLKRSELRDDMMYIWLGKYDRIYFHVPLALISDYVTWTWERFLDEMFRLADENGARISGEW